MSPTEARKQIVQLVAVIVVSSIVLAGLVIGGFVNQSNLAHGQIRTSERTECRAKRNAALDQARWNVVADLFDAKSRAESRAIGERLHTYPTSLELANKGGTIDGVHFGPCPAPINAKGEAP